jgi:hypothetical protein
MNNDALNALRYALRAMPSALSVLHLAQLLVENAAYRKKIHFGF